MLYDALARTAYSIYKKTHRSASARRFIPLKLGMRGFLRSLNEKGVRYVVLRWFELLPELPSGEDLDLLIADDDLERVQSLLTRMPRGGAPCDVYTCSGIQGTDYQGIPYFPVHRAREIIQSPALHDGWIRIPDPQRYFLSLAYHAVYHKGYDSGLPSEERKDPPARAPDHDYGRVLREAAARANLRFPGIGLEEIDSYLDGLGWRPPHDVLERLSGRNAWIHDRFIRGESGLQDYLRGFTVFIVREMGVPLLEKIRSTLQEEGFFILCEKRIENEAREICSREMRGGNWGKGPWAVSGGPPAEAIAAYDCYPIEPEDKLAAAFPGLRNARIMTAKNRVRDLVNRGRPESERCNVLHSADSARQGMEYARLAMPDLLPSISQNARNLHEGFRTPFPVKRNLSQNSRRAKVELVDYHGTEAVCKTFRPGCDRFLKRELLARTLGEGLPEISPVIESGPNYLITKFYDNRMKEHFSPLPLFAAKRFLPIWVCQSAIRIVSHFRRLGFEYIDFQPHNILLDRAEGLKIIDMEFLQESGLPSSGIKGSWAWYGIPPAFQGDVPCSDFVRRMPYRAYWLNWTGIPLFLWHLRLPKTALFIVRIVTGVLFSVFFMKRGIQRFFKNAFSAFRGSLVAVVKRGAALSRSFR